MLDILFLIFPPWNDPSPSYHTRLELSNDAISCNFLSRGIHFQHFSTQRIINLVSEKSTWPFSFDSRYVKVYTKGQFTRSNHILEKKIKWWIHKFLKRNHIFSINHLSICIENHLCDQNQLEKLREKKRKLASIPWLVLREILNLSLNA